MLTGQSGPVRTTEILETLSGEGIDVPGKCPRSNLAAILSHDDDFVPIGQRGWILREYTSIPATTFEATG